MDNRFACATVFALTVLNATSAAAQTTAGTSATIVIPVIAQTASFGSEVELRDNQLAANPVPSGTVLDSTITSR